MSQRHPIQNDVPMLVTIVTKDRMPFFKHEPLAREAVEALYRTQCVHAFFLFGFVVMPDHCHLLLNVPPPETIAGVIKSYKSAVTFSSGYTNIWQPRFHLRIIESCIGALRYIHENPVKDRLVDNSQQYPWSSASGKWDVSSLD